MPHPNMRMACIIAKRSSEFGRSIVAQPPRGMTEARSHLSIRHTPPNCTQQYFKTPDFVANFVRLGTRSPAGRKSGLPSRRRQERRTIEAMESTACNDGE